MEDERRKAASNFNQQAIREAVQRMKQELVAATEAAHKAKDAGVENYPDDYDEFHRTVELGGLVECLCGLCGPHLAVLHEIAHALDELHATEHEHEQKIPHHHH